MWVVLSTNYSITARSFRYVPLKILEVVFPTIIYIIELDDLDMILRMYCLRHFGRNGRSLNQKVIFKRTKGNKVT